MDLTVLSRATETNYSYVKVVRESKWLSKNLREAEVRLSNDNQSLLYKVINAQYGKEDKWMTKEVDTPYGVSFWRSIGPSWSELKSKTKIKVYDGSKTSFQEDNWHEIRNLK